MEIKPILFCIFTILLHGIPLTAGDIILGLNGRTKHEIVIPDTYKSKTAENSVRRASELMQKCFAANNIKLKIVRE